MSTTTGLRHDADSLRGAFDQSFVLPRAERSVQVEGLLSIRVAGNPLAILLREVSGIVARPTVVPVPADAPALLGVAGVRGEILPVFSLSMLLGYGNELNLSRWLLICGTEEPLGLSFSELEGTLELPRSQLYRSEEGASLSAARRRIDPIAPFEGGARPILNLSWIVSTIRSGLQPTPEEPG